MTSRPPVELAIDQKQIVAVGKALKAEADGKILRRELIKSMRATATPLVEALKASALAIPASKARSEEPLRPQIARAIKPAVRLSGERTGITIKASRTPGIRGFSMAARRMNRQSFRHRVFGRDVWVVQIGQEGWFDHTVEGRREDIKRDVMKAVEATVSELRKRGNPH
jgi:hypothetical protein